MENYSIEVIGLGSELSYALAKAAFARFRDTYQDVEGYKRDILKDQNLLSSIITGIIQDGIIIEKIDVKVEDYHGILKVRRKHDSPLNVHHLFQSFVDNIYYIKNYEKELLTTLVNDKEDVFHSTVLKALYNTGLYGILYQGAFCDVVKYSPKYDGAYPHILIPKKFHLNNDIAGELVDKYMTGYLSSGKDFSPILNRFIDNTEYVKNIKNSCRLSYIPPLINFSGAFTVYCDAEKFFEGDQRSKGFKDLYVVVICTSIDRKWTEAIWFKNDDSGTSRPLEKEDIQPMYYLLYDKESLLKRYNVHPKDSLPIDKEDFRTILDDIVAGKKEAMFIKDCGTHKYYEGYPEYMMMSSYGVPYRLTEEEFIELKEAGVEVLSREEYL